MDKETINKAMHMITQIDMEDYIGEGNSRLSRVAGNHVPFPTSKHCIKDDSLRRLHQHFYNNLPFFHKYGGGYHQASYEFMISTTAFYFFDMILDYNVDALELMKTRLEFNEL